MLLYIYIFIYFTESEPCFRRLVNCEGTVAVFVSSISKGKNVTCERNVHYRQLSLTFMIC